jgi:signal transduction histidine kinase
MTLAYNYFLYSSIFSAVVATVLGFLVLLKNPKSSVNRFFALFCLAFCAWSYAYIGWPLSKTAESTLFWFQLLHIGASYVSIAYLHFVIIWLNLKNRFNKIVLIIGYLLSTFFAVNTFSPLFIADMRPIFSMRFWAVPGPLYHFFLIMFFGLFLYASYILLINVRKSVGINRKQIQFVLIGMVLAFLGGSTNYFLWYGINIPPYGNLFGASFVVFTAYAILKYRFMDIRLIIKRSAVFAFLILTITAIYAIVAYFISFTFSDLIGVQSELLHGILTAIFVAIGFEPLKKWLSQVTDNFLFKAAYKPQEVLAEFSDELTSTLDLKSISEYIVSKNYQVFKATKASLFLWDKDKNKYQVANRIDSQTERLESIDETLFAKIFEYLKKKNLEKDIIVRDELKKVNEQLENKIIKLLIEQLDRYEVSLIVPMYVKDELVGILFLGDKKSGDIYSSEDIRVLGIIAGQAAIAIKNTQLFDEQIHFTEHLKDEVEKATKELRVANVQLKKLDEAKSEFISIASHQLRTPLTVIKGYLSMIDQGDFGSVPEKITGPLDKVSKSTVRIISLVEDLLNISRIESGRLKYDFEQVDITALTAEVFEELEMHAKNKGLKFTFEKPAKKIPLLKLDRNKIRETLMNLMDNALKYTEKGWVKVNLEKLDGHVRFSVSDSGRGIAPDEMPQLFQKFSRIQGVQLVHTEGTGLGLYIAKEILKKHHAKIWAESKGTGKGSTFIIEFRIDKLKD